MSEHEVSSFFIFLTDLIQLYVLNDDPCILMIDAAHDPRLKGVVAIADYHISHASCGELEGVEALFELLRWPGGQVTRRVVGRAPQTTIERDLSTLLMDAYEHVMNHGTVLSEASQRFTAEIPTLPLPSDLAEETGALSHAPPTEEYQKGALQLYRRVLWGETLRREIQEVPGLISFQLFDIHGEPQLHAASVEPGHVQVAERLIGALRDGAMIDAQPLELYLNLEHLYHAIVRLPMGSYLLHGVFDVEEIMPGMIQFKIREIIETLTELRDDAPAPSDEHVIA